MKPLRHWALHLILFAIFPILTLLAFNIAELRFLDGVRGFIVLPLVAALLTSLVRLIVKDWSRAALISSFVFILLFSYGPVYDLLKQVEVFGLVLGRHRWLVPAYAILLLGGAILLARTSKQMRLTEFANITSLALLVFSLFQIISFEFRSSQTEVNAASVLDIYEIDLPEDGVARDVYYIILDEYARDDVLLELGHDNAPFLTKLEDLGFAVVECSRSNYALTSLSLTSSMNMDYLDKLGIGLSPDALPDDATFDTIIRRDSRVIRIFEELGYTTVGFRTGRRLTKFETADYYLSPNLSWVDRLRMGQGLTELEALLLQNSIGRILFEENVDLPEFANADLIVPDGRDHYDLINFVLDELRGMPELESPKFVFAHMLIPHKPYVFSADGSFTPSDDDVVGYLDQVEFINRELLDIFEILVNEPVPPIIILQSDHGGPGFKLPERLYNLEAFYFPEQDDDELYQTMTPVNIFRYIFNTYFGSDLEQIENRSYVSGYSLPFYFTEIVDEREGCMP